MREARKRAGGVRATHAGGGVDVKSASTEALSSELIRDGAENAQLIRSAAAREKLSWDIRVDGLENTAEDLLYQSKGLRHSAKTSRFQAEDTSFTAKNILNSAKDKIYQAEDIRWNVEELKNKQVDYRQNADAYDIEAENIKTNITNLKESAKYLSKSADSAATGGLIGGLSQAGSAVVDVLDR